MIYAHSCGELKVGEYKYVRNQFHNHFSIEQFLYIPQRPIREGSQFDIIKLNYDFDLISNLRMVWFDVCALHDVTTRKKIKREIYSISTSIGYLHVRELQNKLVNHGCLFFISDSFSFSFFFFLKKVLMYDVLIYDNSYLSLFIIRSKYQSVFYISWN